MENNSNTFIKSISSQKSWSFLIFCGYLLFSATLSAQQWKAKNFTKNQHFYQIQFLNDSIGFAIGDSGVILKTTDGGENWIQQDSITSERLLALNFKKQTAFIVGKNGTILKTNNEGQNWQKQNISNHEELRGIFCLNAKQAFIVGQAGLILKTTDGGEHWQQKNSGTPQNLNDVFFIHDKVGFAVGFGGTVLKTIDGGESWEKKALNFIFPLQKIYFISEKIGFIIGFGGIILQTTDAGETWTQKQSFTNQWLYGIDFIDEKRGFIVGNFGTILQTTDGGEHWAKQTTQVKQPLYNTFFTNENMGFVVGAKGTFLAYKQPKILVKHKKIQADTNLILDLGGVMQGEEVVFSLLIENTGTEILQIEDIRFEAGVYYESQKNYQILPKKAEKITFTLDTKTLGEKNTLITIQNNTLNQTNFQVQVRSRVIALPIPPETPQNLQVQDVPDSINIAKISWEIIDEVDSCTIERQLVSENTQTSFEIIGTWQKDRGTPPMFLDENLAAGTTYFYRIKAHKDTLNSDYSEVKGIAFIENYTQEPPVFSQELLPKEARVYPNPSTDIFYLEGIPENASFLLINPQGKILMQGVIDKKATLNLVQQPEGIYQLVIFIDKEKKSFTLIKQ